MLWRNQDDRCTCLKWMYETILYRYDVPCPFSGFIFTWSYMVTTYMFNLSIWWDGLSIFGYKQHPCPHHVNLYLCDSSGLIWGTGTYYYTCMWMISVRIESPIFETRHEGLCRWSKSHPSFCLHGISPARLVVVQFLRTKLFRGKKNRTRIDWLLLVMIESHSMYPRRNSIMGSICIYMYAALLLYGPTLESSVVTN